MKNIILPFLFAFLLSFQVLADDSSAKKTASFGFGLGPTYGAGLIGRYDWEKWGLQGSILPYYTPDSAKLVGGVTGFYFINSGKYGNLYASLGVAGEADKKIVYDNIIKPDCVNIVNSHVVWDKNFAVGPGLGLQFNFAENFAISFEVPIAMIFNVNSGIKLDSIRPFPNGSLLYSF